MFFASDIVVVDVTDGIGSNLLHVLAELSEVTLAVVVIVAAAGTDRLCQVAQALIVLEFSLEEGLLLQWLLQVSHQVGLGTFSDWLGLVQGVAFLNLLLLLLLLTCCSLLSLLP